MTVMLIGFRYCASASWLAEAVISAEVFRLAGLEPPSAPVPLELRGRRRPLPVGAVPRLAELRQTDLAA